MSPSNDNNPLLQGEDQDGVHRQQAEAVHHLLQEEDWDYEEGLFLCSMSVGTKISVSN